MLHIDYGLGVLKASILGLYPQNEAFDLSNLYNKLSLDGQLEGFEVFERFYEIGSHEGIADTENYLLQKIKGRL